MGWTFQVRLTPGLRVQDISERASEGWPYYFRAVSAFHKEDFVPLKAWLSSKERHGLVRFNQSHCFQYEYEPAELMLIQMNNSTDAMVFKLTWVNWKM